MMAAYDAVEHAAQERSDRPDYLELLSRKPTLDDFAGTLLLAVHVTVTDRETDYSLVMTCQVGDGMMAAIDHKGGFQLLAQPDKGSYGGETVFITQKAKLGRAQLVPKTHLYISPMRTLMVMTDGVADIYFPPDPEILRLYGDLVLGGVLGIRGSRPQEIESALEETPLRTIEALKTAPYDVPMLAVTAEGPKEVRLPSMSVYADQLKRSIPEVVACPALLQAGIRQIAGTTMDPADRLRLWLDSYMVRGERDDRTLVILHREEVS